MDEVRERTIDDTATAETAYAEDTDDDGALGRRAVKTRNAILDAARKLFLDRGYAGTRINNITDACGISRAGFYTYFKDKREVLNLLGEVSYRDALDIVGRWNAIADPCAHDDVENWVRAYFDFMDVHGAFIFSSAQSPPPDEEFREGSRRMQMRVAWLLGVALRNRQHEPTDAPEALGLATMAMLDHSWFHSRAQRLPVSDDDMIRTIAAMILATIRAQHLSDR
jgi:AcrR family transcriptional regulator